MFELSPIDSHRNSVINENLKFSSEKITSIKQFLYNRQKLQRKHISRINNRNSAQESLNESKAFLHLVSLVPDEVLYNSSQLKVRSFEAAVMFADISGFTDLSELFMEVDNGASKLSMVLNFYLGIMVQEILSHNGDIIKYAGDAFIAIFRQDKCLSMQNSVQNAVDTALIIQKNCRNYCTEIGVVLNGNLYFLH